MKNRSWIEQKELLCNLIRQISDKHGGDDPDWLADYTSDIIRQHADDLKIAINLYKILADQPKKG